MITGDYPLDGYLPILSNISGFGQTLDSLTRATSVDNAELKFSDEAGWRRAVKWFGVRNTPCSLYFGVWDNPVATGGAQITWQHFATYWATTSDIHGSGIRTQLQSIEGLLTEKQIPIPQLLGRHPLQWMVKILEWAGFESGVDARIDWASLVPSADPTRGHFNLTHYHDYDSGIHTPAQGEDPVEFPVWTLLAELALLMGGTIRQDVLGRLTYVPFDLNAPAIEVWDLGEDTGFDGLPPETLEIEGNITNVVRWEYAQTSGNSSDAMKDDPRRHARSSTFQLQDEASVQFYGDTHEVSFDSRWLNGVSFGGAPAGADGTQWDYTGGAPDGRQTYNLGDRATGVNGSGRSQADVNSGRSWVFWHSLMKTLGISGGIFVELGTEGVGTDTELSLYSASINGFCGTRTTGLTAREASLHTQEPSPVYPLEDAVSGLSVPAGRRSYLQLESPTTVVRSHTWESALGKSPPVSAIGTSYRFRFAGDAIRLTPQGSPITVDPPRSEVITLSALRAPVVADISTQVTDSYIWDYFYQAYVSDRDRLLPKGLLALVDTSYNSEGFTNGRGGLGTLPPRRNYSDAITVDDGSADGGWYLGGKAGKDETRISDVTIQTYRSKDILEQFSFGAWKLKVVTPPSKLRFQIGDVISVISPRFIAPGRDGLDATVTFEITGRRLAPFGFSVDWEITKLKDSSQPPVPGSLAYPTVPAAPVVEIVPRSDNVTNNALEDVYTAEIGGTNPFRLVTT
ncbi:MAG: hypothetical protein JKY94_16755 [Rhodobacteraceae bacterium]|nr:hypothetical protein [Paracoccaceae bacterium]